MVLDNGANAGSRVKKLGIKNGDGEVFRVPSVGAEVDQLEVLDELGCQIFVGPAWRTVAVPEKEPSEYLA